MQALLLSNEHWFNAATVFECPSDVSSRVLLGMEDMLLCFSPRE